MIGVLSVDDHALLREGIAALVNAESDMKIVAEATNGQEAIEKFRSHRPDVTLMDLQMPALNGIEAIIGIRSEFPNARIIVLTTYAGDVQVLRALKAGARGYILKGHVRRELLDTIRAVHAGQKRIPPEVAAELAEHAADDDLTIREIAVLRLIAAGNANKVIAGPTLYCRGHGQESRHEYTRQARRKRPDPCRHDRAKARHHRTVAHRAPRRCVECRPMERSPESRRARSQFQAFQFHFESHKLLEGVFCNGYSRRSLVVGRA